MKRPAEKGKKGKGTPVEHETQRHYEDWQTFARLTFWVTATIAAILILMRIFLV